MNFEELPGELTVEENGDFVRLSLGDASTGWISKSDTFFERISSDRLNEFFRLKHLLREIEAKNTLDEGVNFLKSENNTSAVRCLDDVLYYDETYFEALIGKSHALFAQGHFVKSLRFYKRAVKSGCPEDVEYHKLLLKKSHEERDAFPKIKRNIYAGDEAASKGDFSMALQFYERALEDSSAFRDKILFKLLNKKAFALVKLGRLDEALACFDESVNVHKNDLAYFGKGCCEFELGADCISSLKNARKIDKRHLLRKAEIFNELELYSDALDYFNEFLDNHFTVDSSFKQAVEGKAHCLEKLNMDAGPEREIISRLR